MATARTLRLVAALILLSSICADIVISRCDLPSAGGRAQAAVSSAPRHESSDRDRCLSGCVPDCFTCSRSEVAVAIDIASQPQVVLTRLLQSDVRARDGVLPLPYHPPLQLL